MLQMFNNNNSKVKTEDRVFPKLKQFVLGYYTISSAFLFCNENDKLYSLQRYERIVGIKVVKMLKLLRSAPATMSLSKKKARKAS